MDRNGIVHSVTRSTLYLKGLLFLIVIVLFSSCSSFIPRSGPSSGAIERHVQQLENNISLVDVDSKLILQLKKQTPLFSDLWQAEAYDGTLGVGDVVKVTIWEAPPALLFLGQVDVTGSGTAHVTELPPQIIDQTGTIRIPFVGLIPAIGKTPAKLGVDICTALRGKANQPQVLVSLANNFSSEVIVIRDGKATNMTLTTKGERIMDAVTTIGGPPGLVHQTSLQLTRGDQVCAVPLTQIINDPRQNILLHAGDVVSILNQPLSFVILGAAGRNQEVAFENEGITLAEALGRTGGLSDNRANARGLFIFRYESDENPTFDTDQEHLEIASRKAIVYHVDLLNPDSFFHIQNFMLQDKDILYVSNAPATELQKFLRAILGWLSPSISVANTVN